MSVNKLSWHLFRVGEHPYFDCFVEKRNHEIILIREGVVADGGEANHKFEYCHTHNHW